MQVYGMPGGSPDGSQWVRLTRGVELGGHHGPGEELQVEGPVARQLIQSGAAVPIDGPSVGAPGVTTRDPAPVTRPARKGK